jgi:hypothetical protein
MAVLALCFRAPGGASATGFTARDLAGTRGRPVALYNPPHRRAKGDPNGR